MLSPASPTYQKSNSFRAHTNTTHGKEKAAVFMPYSSRKVGNVTFTPDHKLNSQITRIKTSNSEKNNEKIMKNNGLALNANRLSLNSKEELMNLQKKIPKTYCMNSTFSKTNRKNEEKNMVISNFDENIKKITSPINFKEKHYFSNKTMNCFSPKIEENLTNIYKNSEISVENKKDGLKNNEVFKINEWDFKNRKKENFLSNIVNLMNNKMLNKGISKVKNEENQKNLTVIDGKENSPQMQIKMQMDEGKEKKEKLQTKIYQYILDH